MAKKEKYDLRYVGIGVLVLVLIVSVYLFRGNIIRFWYESTVDQKCVEENGIVKNSDYASGELMVFFRGNVSEETAGEIIGLYGLKLDKFGLVGSANYMARVSVPVGMENKWICILENSKSIEYVMKNMRTKAL